MVEIVLPTFHAGQIEAFMMPGWHKAIRCGRRWGKTTFCAVWVADGAIKGLRSGWFTPDYKTMLEAWTEVTHILAPIISASNFNEKIIRTTTGGHVDFWTLENPRAGRSRKYHRVVGDEIAFAKPSIKKQWETSIQPTMLDYNGRSILASTPNGDDPENYFYQACMNPELGYVAYHAPTWSNPHMPSEVIEHYRRIRPPLVFAQEFGAEFVNWAGVAFFAEDKLLLDKEPLNKPENVSYVFATIDTTMKGGEGRDGTAVSYWAVQNLRSMPGQSALMLLDWDLVEFEGSLLEAWIPQVFARLTVLSKETRALRGSIGAFIEDKAIGSVLLQQGARRGWPVMAIESKLTELGKDARAINASSYYYQGMVKITRDAMLKTTSFRGIVRNHWLSQVTSYRPGDKEADKRQDDCLDTFTYGVALALGSPTGF